MNLQEFLEKSGEEESLLSVVATLAKGIKLISHNIHDCHQGEAGRGENVCGDTQMTLDIVANQLLEKELKENKYVHSYASEEEEIEVELNPEGKYCIAFDPLDGSSLINTNLAIGSIFGVYEGKDFVGQKGDNQLFSAYAVYGPRTTFAITFGKGVYIFSLNTIGDFVLTHDNPRVAEVSKIFSPGNLRAVTENPNYLKLVNEWMMDAKTLRYSGGMVPDVNQIFCKGSGIFSYPSHTKYPSGKLRLLYECAPFAFLMEAAGGSALDEKGKRILDIEVIDLHQRSSLFIGSKNEVEKSVEYLKS